MGYKITFTTIDPLNVEQRIDFCCDNHVQYLLDDVLIYAKHRSKNGKFTIKVEEYDEWDPAQCKYCRKAGTK